MAEVLPAPLQTDGQSYFSSPSLRRSPQSKTSLFIGGTPSYSPKSRRTGRFGKDVDAYSTPSSTSSTSSSPDRNLDSIVAGSSSSFSSNSTGDASDDTGSESEDEDEDMMFSEFGRRTYEQSKEESDPPPSPRDMSHAAAVAATTHKASHSPTPDIIFLAEDDTAIKQEPSRHVDYLSHEWREEDIWSSWKHIVSKRKFYGERSRLENASWRTWAKQKNKLKTVPPDSLNWLKDCDVTWLYGPLQTATRYSVSEPTSEPPSYLSQSNSFLNKKPILKKRSMSEVMLQKSISASSLVRQAAAAVQAQQGLPPRSRMPDSVGNYGADSLVDIMPSAKASIKEATEYFSSRSTSGLQTPAEQGEKKHIRFDDKVEQCIAVEIKEGEYEDEEDCLEPQDDDSSDDGIIMMKAADKRKPLRSHSSSRRNSANETKIIAKLPSTTLKYRTDSPDVPDINSHSIAGSSWRAGRLSPSPSLETLRPSNPSRNFLLEDDDEDTDDNMSWEPTTAFGDGHDSSMSLADGEEDEEENEDEDDDYAYSKMDTDERFGGMRRTESGMFMPYESEGEVASMSGLLGRVVDTVNTARDIAHVIWNVGWRR